MFAKRILGTLLGSMLAASTAMTSASAAEKVSIGFVSTFSGPASFLGKHQFDGFSLAVEQLGGKLGGLPVEVSTNDDQVKPDLALQIAEKLATRDQVDIVVGLPWSNILLAMYNTLIDNKIITISTNAGPSSIAGKDCSPYFFNTSFQNDQAHAAAGRYLQEAGVKRVFLIVSNYQAGLDAVAGFKSQFKGEIVGEVYPALRQADYSVELAQVASAKPDVVYAFVAGAAAGFTKQYVGSGLMETVPMVSSFTVYGPTLPAIGDIALGAKSVAIWTPDLDNAANKTFVAEFQKKYGYMPTNLAAQSYDAARLIDAAITQISGKVEDKELFLEALKTAKFDSVRGPFRFGSNQFPIENIYISEIAKNAAGELIESYRGTIIENDVDAYASDCPMK